MAYTTMGRLSAIFFYIIFAVLIKYQDITTGIITVQLGWPKKATFDQKCIKSY